MKSKKSALRTLCMVICVCMIFTYVSSAMAVLRTGLSTNSNNNALKKAADGVSDAMMDSLRTGVSIENNEIEEISPDTMVNAIVVLTGAPLYSFSGITENTKDASDILSAISYQQDRVKTQISKRLFCGEELDITYSYKRIMNGFSMTVPYGMLDEINKLDGVLYAYAENSYKPAEYEPTEKGQFGIGFTPDAHVNMTQYKGEGTVIAVLDTGIQLDHPLFAGGIRNAKLTKSDVQSIIDSGELIATQHVPGLSADIAYYSEKIAYQFDYANKDTDSTHDGSSYHGTHVAGIAAGNDGVESGVDSSAPEAQLLIMKVFKLVSGGESAYDSDIFAALEDCTKLGVDVVNMSLGSTCGFSSTYGYENFDTVLANCQNAGIILSVAAGNDGSSATSNLIYGYMYSNNPDCSTVGSPASFIQSLAVASCTYDGEISSFSSWGATPDLVLKPEITCYGTHVYSSMPGSTYGSLNGTSMATPGVAGGVSAVVQYLSEKYPSMSAYDQQELAITLLMNTSDRLYVRSDGSMYSPRLQGAGFMNIRQAVKTPVYITVADSIRPAFDQFDDVERTGEYSFSFTLHNMSDSEHSYTLDVSALTEAVTTTMNYTTNSEMTVLSGKSYELSPYVYTEYDNNTVTVPANGDFTATIKLRLSRADIAYYNKFFADGMYLEGFIELVSEEDTDLDLSIPFLGYYGDWTYAATIDRGTYADVLNGDVNLSNQYTTALYTIFNSELMYMGQNPYHSELDYNEQRNSISPNADGRAENIRELRLSLLRNVRTLTYSITDGENEYYHRDMEYITKTYYYSYYVGMLYAGLLDESTIEPWHGTDNDGAVLPNNTTVSLNIDTTLDYTLHEQNNERSSISFPVTIDLEKPTVTDVRTVMSNGRTYLFVTATDNRFVADITISDENFTSVRASYGVYEDMPGAEKTYCYEITGYENTLGLTVTDYACNSTSYVLNTRDCLDDARPNEDNTVLSEDFSDCIGIDDSILTLDSENDSSTWGIINIGETYAFIDPDRAAQNEMLVMPSVDTDEYDTELRLAYSFMADAALQEKDCEFAVYVRNDMMYQNTWAKIFTSKNQLAFHGNEWNDARILIPAKFQTHGNMQLALCYTTEDGKVGCDFSLDNIVLFDTGHELCEVDFVNMDEEPDAFSVAEALNIPGGTIEYENDEVYPWINENRDGRSYIRSTNNDVSMSTSTLTIRKHIEEAGTALTFDWRASCENGWEFLTLWINGERIDRLSGETDWETYNHIFTASGDYVIAFTYAKDQSVNEGNDCAYLDKLFFTYPVSVEQVNLVSDTATIEKYGYFDLCAQIVPENAMPNTLTFESSDENIATVDEFGVVHALREGTVAITATAINGVSATCEITVVFDACVPTGCALVAFVARDVFGNDTGYKLMLDSDATAFDTCIPTSGYFDDAESAISEFEYCAPSGDISVVVKGGVCYSVLPAQEYDYAVVNPAYGKLWVADGELAVGDNVELAEGTVYIFTVTKHDNTDNVELMQTQGQIFELGDVNCDGTVNSGDATLVLSYTVGLRSLTESQRIFADITGNGIVNVGDAVRILRLSVGITD